MPALLRSPFLARVADLIGSAPLRCTEKFVAYAWEHSFPSGKFYQAIKLITRGKLGRPTDAMTP